MDSDSEIDPVPESADGAAVAGNQSSAAGGSGSCRSPLAKPDLLVGVVEGFYGRPWTTEQRKDLFTKMQVRILDFYQ